MGERQPQPFYVLGNRIKSLREEACESLAEVSFAVEIDMDTLAQIEQGKMQPSEDILLLLISHFGLKEKEATTLMRLAGYNDKADDQGEDVPKQVFMVLPIDNRVLFSDDVEVSANRHGVVLNFSQSLAGEPSTVARIGISKEHAETIIQLLQVSLENINKPKIPKALPAPRNDKGLTP